MASSSKSKSVKKTSKTSCNYKNAFNKSLVGTVDAIRVQPNILRVDPTRYREEKLIFYITNLSDVPQHLNVLRFGQPGSLTALNSVKLLEPGKTATCVLQVCNLDFSKDANSQVYSINLVVESNEVFEKRFQQIAPGPKPVVQPKLLAQNDPVVQDAKCVKDALMQKFINHNKPKPTIEWIFQSDVKP